MPQYQSNPHQVDASFHLWIDGQCLNRVCVQDNAHRTIRGARVGESQRRPFIFSSIITTGKVTAACWCL